MNTRFGYVHQFNAQERHIQPAPTTLPSTDLKTDRIQDGVVDSATGYERKYSPRDYKIFSAPGQDSYYNTNRGYSFKSKQCYNP